MNKNGKITKPIGLAEVYGVLGIMPKPGSNFDLGQLCRNGHGAINKWSVIKPIRRDTPAELNSADFAGTAAEHQQGIYYGLRVAGMWGALKTLHGCNFEYLAPAEGDWCRLSDFDGYNHKSYPNPWGDIPKVMETQGKPSIRIEYNPNGTHTGFDLDNVAISGNPSVKGNIGNWYPCLLVSDLSGAVNYVRPLERYLWEIFFECPLYANDEWGDTYYLNWDNAPAFVTEPGEKLMTLFFLPSLYQNGVFDLRQRWTEVTNLVTSVRGLACPLASAIKVQAKDSSAAGIRLMSVAAAGLKLIAVYEWVRWSDCEEYEIYYNAAHVQVHEADGTVVYSGKIEYANVCMQGGNTYMISNFDYSDGMVESTDRTGRYVTITAQTLSKL